MSRIVRFAVVDADHAIRSALCSLMCSIGHEAVGFATAEDVLATGAGRYDLIFADARLPTMGGIDLIRSLRARHEAIPIVLLSSDTAAATAARAVRVGATEFLVKSFSVADLAASVISALASVAFRSGPDRSR